VELPLDPAPGMAALTELVAEAAGGARPLRSAACRS
jgi:hypothetical protein